jgi:hypothetical protein
MDTGGRSRWYQEWPSGAALSGSRAVERTRSCRTASFASNAARNSGVVHTEHGTIDFPFRTIPRPFGSWQCWQRSSCSEAAIPRPKLWQQVRQDGGTLVHYRCAVQERSLGVLAVAIFVFPAALRALQALQKFLPRCLLRVTACFSCTCVGLTAHSLSVTL